MMNLPVGLWQGFKHGSLQLRWCVLALLVLLMQFGISTPASATSVLPSTLVTQQTKLFCSHYAPGVDYIRGLPGPTSPAADTSKVVNATALINGIVRQIGQMDAWQNTFRRIVQHPTFSGAVMGAMLLYVVIFGIMMVFGMVNVTWYEVFIRLLKLAAVAYLLFGSGMSDIVARFIMGGMNELIDAYYNATIGAYPLTLTNPTGNVQLTVKPLMFLIAPMEKVLNLQFICSALAFMVAGTAGMGLSLFLLFGLFSFFMTIIGALATYIKAVIGLTILFSIAPIFIACLLFEQTRRLFDGWLSMCLSFALQPVFIFAFLGFFMVMLDGALTPLTRIHWCYGPVLNMDWVVINFYYPVPPELFGGGMGRGVTVEVWTNPGITRQTSVSFVPLTIEYGVKVKDLWRAAGVDLYVVDVMMFCLLSTLCWKYSDYTSQIAREIVGGGVSIAVTGGEMAQNMANYGLDPKSLAGNVTDGVKSVGNEINKAYENFSSGAGKADTKNAYRASSKDFNQE